MIPPQRGHLPLSRAGQWVARSRDGEPLTSAHTLAEVRAFIERNRIEGRRSS